MIEIIRKKKTLIKGSKNTSRYEILAFSSRDISKFCYAFIQEVKKISPCRITLSIQRDTMMMMNYIYCCCATKQIFRRKF